MFTERQTSLSWLVAGTLVALTHVAIGAALIYEQASQTPPSSPPQAAAIAINMVPPPPEQTTPEPKPEPEPLPKAPPKHDAVIPEPEPEPEETPEPEPEPEPRPEPPQPPSEPVESENLEGVSNPSETVDAKVDWQGRLLIHLEQHKRYPRMARRRHLEGVVQIEFEMDRNGQVYSVRIKKSSGHGMLDKETENLLNRAQPLPKPPEAVQGERITLIVPVEFELR